MTTEQKEAIDRLNFHKDFAQIPNNCAIVNVDDIEIVLQIIENSIPKEEVEKYLEEEQERFEVYKKESETNENLKLGMWRHLGAKNMCERILGIEKIVTLD